MQACIHHLNSLRSLVGIVFFSIFNFLCSVLQIIVCRPLTFRSLRCLFSDLRLLITTIVVHLYPTKERSEFRWWIHVWTQFQSFNYILSFSTWPRTSWFLSVDSFKVGRIWIRHYTVLSLCIALSVLRFTASHYHYCCTFIFRLLLHINFVWWSISANQLLIF
jgi:hypothetical protein